jgi:hypothetical protein
MVLPLTSSHSLKGAPGLELRPEPSLFGVRVGPSDAARAAASSSGVAVAAKDAHSTPSLRVSRSMNCTGAIGSAAAACLVQGRHA